MTYLEVALDAALCMYSLLKSTGVIIVPAQMKCKNRTSLYIFHSFLFILYVLNTILHQVATISHVKIFVSTIEHNLENSREGKSIVFTHISGYCVISPSCFKIPFLFLNKFFNVQITSFLHFFRIRLASYRFS
jgi:hypothetical protein